MIKADCFHLGYIAKLHGFKGEVSLFLDVTNPNDYASLDAIFIDLGDNLTPFFIESIKLKNKGFAAVKLEGVKDEVSAKKLLRKNVYLPAQILPELEGVHFYDHEVIGFKVIDEVHGEIGELAMVIDLKVNPLLQIMKGEKEILVPLIEGLVQKVDRKNEALHIKAPDGLVELYLG
ncbi:MAG: ribosome maturation factor RimM [Crocinitomicaceae bacterium]|nr:ribosome maturation factor RimM [Crocinitomicaceae bacterium]